MCTICILPAAAVHAGERPYTYTLLKEHRSYLLYELTFPSPVSSLFPQNDTVYAEVWEPRNRSKPSPVIIVLPGIAEPTKWVERRFCKAIVERGMTAVLIELPFQFHRKPRTWLSTRRLFLSYDPKRIKKNYRQAVEDVHRAVTWIREQRSYDHERIGIMGVSLGSLIGLTVMNENEHIKAGVFVLGGADLAGIIWNGAYTRTLSRKLKEKGLTIEILQNEWDSIEPINHIEALHGRPVALYNARWDRIIPKRSVNRLWDAIPHAQKHWIFGGHYTAVLNIFWLPRHTALFFIENFR